MDDTRIIIATIDEPDDGQFTVDEEKSKDTVFNLYEDTILKLEGQKAKEFVEKMSEHPPFVEARERYFEYTSDMKRLTNTSNIEKYKRERAELISMTFKDDRFYAASGDDEEFKIDAIRVLKMGRDSVEISISWPLELRSEPLQEHDDDSDVVEILNDELETKNQEIRRLKNENLELKRKLEIINSGVDGINSGVKRLKRTLNDLSTSFEAD